MKKQIVDILSAVDKCLETFLTLTTFASKWQLVGGSCGNRVSSFFVVFHFAHKDTWTAVSHMIDYTCTNQSMFGGNQQRRDLITTVVGQTAKK